MTPFTLDWWGFVAILLATLGLTFWAGIEFCRSRHQQRGIEVDRLELPDYVPDDWTLGARR